MTADIHPTAIVEAGAGLEDGVRIGPYSLVGAEVEIGAGTVLHSHVVVTGRTRIGRRNEIFPFASIGHRPQDLKYQGEPSELLIGDDNTIREHVTMNPGTLGGGMRTVIGSRCLFMMGAHVAHDCAIGDHVIMANNATLGGHVTIEDYAIIGGLSAVHQFVRIGAHAMIGGMSGVEHDVIPFGSAMGERAHLGGLNLVGMKRRGMSRQDISALRAAYGALFAEEGTLAERLRRVAETCAADSPVAQVVAFLRVETRRAILQPKAGHGD